jgi:hypothetical protein
MGALIIGVISAMGIAFMAIFFVEICREGSRIKRCEVMKIDTEPIVNPRSLKEILEERQRRSAHRAAADIGRVFPMPIARHGSRSLGGRNRKPVWPHLQA